MPPKSFSSAGTRLAYQQANHCIVVTNALLEIAFHLQVLLSGTLAWHPPSLTSEWAGF
jgi:hypothetical protein